MTDVLENSQFPIRTALLLFLLPTAGASVHAAGDDAVLIKQSPLCAGTVDPGMGVHTIDVGNMITLTAVPKPGYRFFATRKLRDL